MPLEACAICTDEKLPEFMTGPPEYRCCRDFEACNRRAYRRLVGRPERRQHSSAEWEKALGAYRRAARRTAVSAVPLPDVEPEPVGEQLTLDWDDAA